MIEQAIINHLGGAPNEVIADWAGRGMTLLTGNDSTWIPSGDYTLEQLTADLAAGNLVTASTKDNPLSDYNLTGNHSYTILSVTGDLVRIYNPWGISNSTGINPYTDIPFEFLVNDSNGFCVQ